MDQTRTTLLLRLRDRADDAAWRTFDALYRPMIVAYAHRRGLDAADAEDVAQQCAQAVLEGIADYQRRGSFKGWLRTIARHKIVDHFRRKGRETRADTALLAETPGEPDDAAWDRDWVSSHLRHGAEVARRELAPTTFEAFEMYALQGRDPADVARALGVSVAQVYVAKHRVVKRIREVLADILGQESEGLVP